MSDGFESHFITAPDGLKLHVRAYGSRAAARLPVMCLPGLARTSADFHALASALAGDTERPRYVLAIDYRGRGLSDYDRDPGNYSLAVELADLLAVLTALGTGPAVFVGTSRGGILTMLLGVARPAAIAGVVLNDIGPVIETRGLVRIKSYVGRLPQPKSFEEGAEFLRRLFGPQFPALTPDDWMDHARRTFQDKNGRIVPNYDPKLARVLEDIDIQRALPPLWKEFDSLGRVPMMVIRGANSDLLTAATVEAMRARRRQCDTVLVADQGHAPLLAEDEIIRHIGAFVAGCEPTGTRSKAEVPGGGSAGDK